jgi:2-polyprenyl-3-methyl-5-hydroxy-6-metoxy-1,4-benzoquinol methylase
MFDLIEHVENPIHLINECKRLLQSDGILVIFTPNFDSLAISIMREDSNLISPAEHLTYFNEKAVLTLAQKVQLELAYYSTNGIDLGDLKSFYESLDKKDLALACNTLFNYLQPLVDAAGAGNHLRFILKMAG